MMYTEFI